MTSREVFEKQWKDKYPETDYRICAVDHYKMWLDYQHNLMLEALKAIDEAINDNCISDAQMMIKNIINQVSGE